MAIVTLSERGQLVIPQAIREQLDLHKGSKLVLEFSAAEQTITLRPLAGARQSLRGLLKGTPALELLEGEHREELARDERRTGR